jgi:hypothetical protein
MLFPVRVQTFNFQSRCSARLTLGLDDDRSNLSVADIRHLVCSGFVQHRSAIG